VQKVKAIIQARTGASRLPNKVLLRLGEKTVLEQVVQRVQKSELITEVIVATTNSKSDLRIAKICADKDIPLFIGSELDVLDRYYQAARIFEAEHVVRVTADCPMIDADIINKVIVKHFEDNADYTSNVGTKLTYPDGLDVEVVKFSALKEAWKNAKMQSEREHVTPYIRNSGKFLLSEIQNSIDYSSKRWTLDNEEDYKFISFVYDALMPVNPQFGMSDVLECLNEHPEWESINMHISRNEGYAKSLKEDKLIKIKE
jgi:spore coat polysaccharide biosynthesis protein SpsF (cytidylyltransferase family)